MAVKNFDYTEKYNSYIQQTYYAKLENENQTFIRDVAFATQLTFQEFRRVVEAARDLSMWGEGTLAGWWNVTNPHIELNEPALTKEVFLNRLDEYLSGLKVNPKTYPAEGLEKPKQRAHLKLAEQHSDKKIFGMCPVASEETVCCNLKTIDAVENCAFGCSYCTIQTFYSDSFTFDADFAKKLKNIELDPNRFYHFGTGQSSDSLIWGNRNGNLDALFDFAWQNPNILLEFKTKSNNINHLLNTEELPPNIVCSWSMNTPTIIANEEHFTADLNERITAARKVADRGVKVSFHFHPMIYYNGWDEDYPEVAKILLKQFDASEVLFISFGSITMIKPAMKKIRNLGNTTKILQMELVPDPHGKLTYPDDVKVEIFSRLYRQFESWQDKVFFYLCMEKAEIWQNTFGFVYPNNETFEKDFLQKCMSKIPVKV